MQATFRAATAEDRQGWVALRFELWPDCPIERHTLEVEQLLSSEGIVLVAESDDVLVAFAEVSVRVDHVEGTHSAPVPYLEGWYVRPDHRRQGIGRNLLLLVEQWAQASGYTELASDAEIENHLSIELHKHLGFSEVGRSVHFLKKLDPKHSL